MLDGVRGLTPKQARFCTEFLVSEDASKAAIAAGYSPNTAYAQGSRLKNTPAIKAYLENAHREAAELATIDKSFILRGIAREAQDESASIRLKALELLGKARGVFHAEHREGGPEVVFRLDMNGGVKPVVDVVEHGEGD